MEIPELKSRLPILEVARLLGISVDKHGKALCPFHDDKKPSLQFSKEKDIATCFSSNCSAGTMDIISLTERYLKLTTKEAISQLKTWAGVTDIPAPKKETTPPYEKLFVIFKASLKKSKKAKDYLETRHLTEVPGIGYNPDSRSGQVATGWPVMKHCIIFPLMNKKNEIVSFYGRSILDKVTSGHYYSKNREGLYPGYPDPSTKKLILTESIIDAATLLQIPAISESYSILALYGTNGFTLAHKEAITSLPDLEEIILFMDGDEPGREAIKKLSTQLLFFSEASKGKKITFVDCPEGEDINSLLDAHNSEIFTHLLNERRSPQPVKPRVSVHETLNTTNPHKLSYKTTIAAYYIYGGILKRAYQGSPGWESMKVTIVIEHPESKRKYRSKTDLYEEKQITRLSLEAAEKLELRSDLLLIDLEKLTDKLEEYREALYKETQKETEAAKTPALAAPERKRCEAFLSAPGVLTRLNKLIGISGVVGEDVSRLFLFIIASSYKMPDTLHALIQGSSGSGKTHLLAKISALIPKESVHHFTRVTEGSFYNYGTYELKNKLICLEDLDGMEEKAQLAFRELQSREMLATSTSGQDETGKVRSFKKEVYGPMASMSCTTRGRIYEDNMGRVFLVAIDESSEQTTRVIKYQNDKSSGKIDLVKQKKATAFIRDLVSLLKPYRVVNPYAGKISLPKEAHKIRRLNELYQGFVKQITLINQYRRKVAYTRSEGTSERVLVAEKEDLRLAAEIMFESIVLKVDELDGSLRQFYERLKDHVRAKGGEHYHSYSFGQREIRQALHLSKTSLQRHIRELLSLEYVSLAGGYSNRGYKYQVSYWDNIAKLRDKVKRHLEGQLDQLELTIDENQKLATQPPGSPDGSPERPKND